MIGVFGLYTKDGASSFDGQFFRQVSDQFPAISAAQNAHTQAIIFEVARLYTKSLTTGHTYSTVPAYLMAVYKHPPREHLEASGGL